MKLHSDLFLPLGKKRLHPQWVSHPRTNHIDPWPALAAQSKSNGLHTQSVEDTPPVMMTNHTSGSLSESPPSSVLNIQTQLVRHPPDRRWVAFNFIFYIFCVKTSWCITSVSCYLNVFSSEYWPSGGRRFKSRSSKFVFVHPKFI